MIAWAVAAPVALAFLAGAIAFEIRDQRAGTETMAPTWCAIIMMWICWSTAAVTIWLQA